MPELFTAQRSTRRSLLKNSLALSATLSLGKPAKAALWTGTRTGSLSPRIAVVGAGISGLCAAYQLRKDGFYARVFEASERLGGRIYTQKNLMAPGFTTELGGEFIDSNHEAMLSLIHEFGLELLDLDSDRTKHEAFFFRGSHYTQAQAIDAFRPLVARIEADAGDLDDEVAALVIDAHATKLDHCSLAEYLDQVGATGWVRNLIEVAYVAEYGLDPADLSALNFLTMISTNVANGRLEIYGESDERYKIKGGNQQLIDALAWQLAGQVELGHKLLALRSAGGGFQLIFATQGGRTTSVDADFVVLAIPFSVLRRVDLQVDLPDRKLRAIRELGYGTNTKIFAGVQRRVWAEQGYTGSVFSDEPFQTAYDNTRFQGGTIGGLTLFSGGQAGVDAGEGTPEEQVERLIGGVERAFPGVFEALNGQTSRFHWPSFPFALGSYACYKPGQYTTIAGIEGLPVGNLFFAGEHCSQASAGYMDGGASSGIRAARMLLMRIAQGR